jgi:hypothetical protein
MQQIHTDIVTRKIVGHRVINIRHGVLMVDLLIDRCFAVQVIVQAGQGVLHPGAVQLGRLHSLQLILPFLLSLSIAVTITS